MLKKINILDGKVGEKGRIIDDMDAKMKRHQENIEHLSKYIDSKVTN